MSRDYAHAGGPQPERADNFQGKRHNQAADNVPFTEDELLKYVRSEREDSVGMDNEGDELLGAREKALEYYRGQVNDLPLLPQRSQVASTDVSDMVETVLPDLLDVFWGGDDILTFRPTGEEDVERAEQETRALRQIVQEENDGFMAFAHAIKDALITRIGVWHAWWEDAEYDTQEREANAIELQQLEAAGVEFQILEQPATPEQPFKIETRVMKHPGMAKFEPLPGEDFAIARDARDLKESTYIGHRARPRMQDLIADGYDPDKVRSLPPYSEAENEEISWDRDFADEGEIDNDGHGDLAKVEVVYHVIRLLNPETGELQRYRVITGHDEGVLLDAEPIDYIPYAAFTPYLAPHRFYGRSVADLMIEVQKVKTNLLRLMLDHGAFATNARPEVDMSLAGEFTISDLLNNIPGHPVRTRANGKGQAVRPLQTGGLAFDVLGAMETVDLMGEKRTGIPRTQMGIKKDALHETASGYLEMAAAAMKRVRLMARMIAESGVKDLFLALHAIMRAHSTHAFKLRLGSQQFEDVDPTAWGNRQDMTIEVGIGSGGRDKRIEDLTAVGDMMGAAIQYQQSGGIDKPIVTAENAHAFYEMMFKARGIKAPEKLLSDPAEAPAQQPQMDPAMMEMMAKTQEQQANLDMKQRELAQKQEVDMAKLQADAQAKQTQMAVEAQLKQMQMVMEAQLKEFQIQLQAAVADRGNMAKANGASTNISDVRPGGDVG